MMVGYHITHAASDNSLIIAVDGCPYNKPEDPGNVEFDWLEMRLGNYRDRGMQVCVTNKTFAGVCV